MTPSQFADTIGIQRSGMSHILAGRNNPSLDFVLKVLASFPEISPSWLLQGKGEMYANMSVSSQAQPELFSAAVSSQTPVSSQDRFSGSVQNGNFSTQVQDTGCENETLLDQKSDSDAVSEVSPVDAFQQRLDRGNTEFIGVGENNGFRRKDNPSSEQGRLTEDDGKACAKINVENSGLKVSSRPVKVLFFYEDGSFEIYYPR